MKLSTLTRTAVVTAVTATLLASCSEGSTTGDGDDAPAADDAAEDDAAEDDGTTAEQAGGDTEGSETESDDAEGGDASGETLTFWLAGETDTPVELEEWLVTAFEEETGATLDVQRIPWGELLQRANQALPDPDNTPDVIEMGNTQVPTYTSVGAFEDLSGLLEELGDIGPEGFIEAGTYEDTVYAVPYYWGSRYIFFDKAAFADAGLEVPTTLEELSTAAIALTEAGGEGFSGLWLPGQDWRNGISWLFAHGGDIAVQEGDQWVGALSSEASIAGLTQWQELYAGASTAPQDGRDAEPWVPFNNGEAAMFMAPSWARWSVEETKAEDLGAFALPGVDGGVAPVFAGGSNIAISAQSQNKELATDLMRLIFSDDYQTMLAENGLGPANPEFTPLMGDDEFAEAAISAAESAKLTPASPEWAAVETATVMEEAFGRIAGGEDVATVAKETDAQLAEMLNP
ncbi:extracellular solute-binding protein [Ornithinimicrobium faecis]|uniref:Extracellular solute-binding protein n=1 Tax=Ornithinimicrobium faecis TaxID=2934158 RepID=A0ABY4YX44_9MICO|nr:MULTISPECIES: extracellular solute-binding protein [unclassified Ornithinimicrobium]USQ81354.1 extracellular solute-binding protein [Ornithinimicrobium sp. HY1793]